MRLCLVISSLDCGGAQRALTTMANHWAGQGREVHVLTLDASGRAPFFPLRPEVSATALDLARPTGSLHAKFADNARRVLALRRELRRIQPGAIVSFLPTVSVLVILASLGLGANVVAAERTEPSRNRPGCVWELLRLATYPLARGVVVQTERARRFFPRWLRPRVHVIPNPVPAPAALPAGPREPLVLGLGRLERLKGFDLLLRAFARIAPRHPGWRVCILGEGQARAELERLVQECGLESRAALPGLVAAPGPWLARAEVFALPSRFEGFPNALCEAMAHGLAVVACDCPSGPAEIIRPGVDGLLVPAENVDALAQTLDALLGDEALRRRLAAQAPEVLERFSVPTVMAAWGRLLFPERA